MLDFKALSRTDIPLIQEICRNFCEYSCEFSAVNLLVWNKYFGFEFCIEDNVLYSKNCINGKTTFGIPFAKDMPRAVAKLKEYAQINGLPFVMFGGQGERLDLLSKQMPNIFTLFTVRDSFDYIYSYEDLSELRGKKYHSKRNHISAFKKKYNWSYEPLSADNSSDVLKMLYHWYDSYSEKAAESMESERQGLTEILSNFSLSGVRGGVLRVDSNIVAFTLGCEISDSVFDVNFEKALVEFSGAYAMINNLFVVNELKNYKYINREEDMGIDGLRKAKLSYYPEILLEKYIITEA
ncbi:MAG: phosphatidylglycerol lysyltransferase domain-containing protein [Acutalibacteraceae bacterium]|nr:phosphatidylglycerol lysyltransferase domain-containing protein [Acutalibacteraceae bacterium]